MEMPLNTRGIARIVKPTPDEKGEKHVGMAIIVDARHVMTCCHVLNLALDRDAHNLQRPHSASQFLIRFPYASNAEELGRVVQWGFELPQAKDVAVLELIEKDAPKEAGIAAFTEIEVQREKWFCNGWAEYGAEREVRGELGMILSKVERQLYGPDGTNAPRIVGGYSGAAVWCDKVTAFVGMVATKDRDEFQTGVTYAIPTGALLQVWPKLPIDLTAIWKLTDAALTDKDLSTLCFAHFREVYDAFAAGQTRGARVRLLVDYVHRQRRVAELLVRLRSLNPRGIETPPDVPKVSVGRLPVTGENVFGRKQELQRLDEFWKDDETNVVSLVAWGGVGKSALVNAWLRALARDDYRGAERVYGWSFHEHNTTDLFINAALRWFGDGDPALGSPWEKGERLAQLVRAHRTLLVLDGLEAIQGPPGDQEGILQDQALQSLLRELAALNTGLCLITTRLPVADLVSFERSSACRLNLEQLSAEDGALLLRADGVVGAEEDLQRVSADFGGHCLTLTLLGTYLRKAFRGDILQLPKALATQTPADRAEQVMAWYEQWLHEGPALSLLRLFGLLDRPADPKMLGVLRAAPPIPSLTDSLQNLPAPDWETAITTLVDARLLTRAHHGEPEALDAHPLVRQHFAAQLRQHAPDAWREGHRRLYVHLQAQAEPYPETLEDMAPLYAALFHGCQAGWHQEALDRVFVPRILRGKEDFSNHQLGAAGADLAALTHFFSDPWTRPVANLSPESRGEVLRLAGFRLLALGQMKTAADPIQAALQVALERQDWFRASKCAGHLVELYLALGQPQQALSWAEQAVTLADRSGELYERTVAHAVRAHVHLDVGDPNLARADFQRAEDLQQEREPKRPLLYFFWGHLYCALLLDEGRCPEVITRARQALAWGEAGSDQGLGLLDALLAHHTLGDALTLQGDFAEAAKHLDDAVRGLRRSRRRKCISPRVIRTRRGWISTRQSAWPSEVVRQKCKAFAICSIHGFICSKEDETKHGRLW